MVGPCGTPRDWRLSRLRRRAFKQVSQDGASRNGASTSASLVRCQSAPKGLNPRRSGGDADGKALATLMPDLVTHLTRNIGSITDFLDYEDPPSPRTRARRLPTAKEIWLPETYQRSASNFLPPNPKGQPPFRLYGWSALPDRRLQNRPRGPLDHRWLESR